MDDETIVVTLLSVRTKPGNPRLPMATFTGDGGRYFYLPGATYPETVKALRAAGFEMGDRYTDAIKASYTDQPTAR